MTRIKYILATVLVALTLGVVHQQPALARIPPPCPPLPCDRAVAEGPIDEPPTIPQGVQASDPGQLAEGELESDGYNLKKGKGV